MFFAAALYAAALPVYLFFRIHAAASGVARGTAAAVPILQDLMRRVSVVDRSRRAAQRAVERQTTVDHALVENVNRLATMSVRRFPADSALGDAVRRSNDLMSQIAAAFEAVGSLSERKRWSDASAQLGIVDSLAAVADEQTLLIASIGRWNLIARQQAVQAVTADMLRDTVLWLLMGLGLLWLGLLVIRRRILEPLGALDAGLARVAEGDLNTRVRVHGSDEIGRLETHFNEMTEVLLARTEEQGRFTAAGQLLADVAHEVGNPLMAIASLAESRIGDAAVRPGQRDEMQQILRQAQRATKLLRGLLRFVRPSQREVTLMNVNDVVRGALDIVAYRFAVDEITFAGALSPGLPAIQGDAVALEQVFVNLLSNAIEALRSIKPPRTLTVDSWASDARVSVRVADNGQGVPPEIMDRLFRPFASTKGRRGAGLGLYISRQIVRQAGGDLALDAGGGAGGRFIVTLPAAGPAEPPAAPPDRSVASPLPAPAAAQRLAGVRILLVDDEEAVRRPMAKFLKRRGAEVFEAADGLQALAMLDRQAVDVILADVRMPRMSGIELFTALERDRPPLAARVLFLSGDASQLGEPGSTQVSRERVLVKPVELAELERRVAQFVKGIGPA